MQVSRSQTLTQQLQPTKAAGHCPVHVDITSAMKDPGLGEEILVTEQSLPSASGFGLQQLSHAKRI